MSNWCKSCKYYGESSSSYPCVVCERAYDNAPTKYEKSESMMPLKNTKAVFDFARKEMEKAKVIASITESRRDIEDAIDSLNKTQDMVIEAMEKQIPKKPYEEYGELHCRACGQSLLLGEDNYCPSCGQAIDWSD